MHMCMAVSPDSQYLVVAGLPAPELQVWSLAHRKKVAVISGHFDAIRDLCFSADGRRLICVSQDNRIDLGFCGACAGRWAGQEAPDVRGR